MTSDLASTLEVALPDSDLCRAATAFARELSPPFLFNHVMRSALFAEHAARAQGARHDPELLCLASVLHDLGLTDASRGESRFEIEGADAAREFLQGRGLSTAALDLVWEAIALHTTPLLPQRRAPEVAFCHIGAGLDVGVMPLDAIEEPFLTALLERYPRLGFKQALIDLLAAQGGQGWQALASMPVLDACERRVPGFRRPHFCDIVEQAAFDE